MKRKEYLQKKKERNKMRRKADRLHRELWNSFNLGDERHVIKCYDKMSVTYGKLIMLRKELREVEIYM